MTGKRENQGDGYGLKVFCKYLFKGNSLVGKWLSGRSVKERKLRMLWPGIKKQKADRKQQRTNSGESCSSAMKARNRCFR